MTRRLWAVVLFVPFLGLALASCTTSKDAAPTTKGTCAPVPESEGLGWDLTASTLSSEGRELTLRKRVVILGDDGESVMAETTIEVDGERIMRMVEADTPDRYELLIDYGALVPGLMSATAVVENGVLTGSVNGRALVPIPLDQEDPPSPRFEDADAGPDPGVDPDIEAATPRLLEIAADAAEQCEPTNGAESSLVEKRGDRGHVSSGRANIHCDRCKSTCGTDLVACDVLVVSRCFPYGLFYNVCVGEGHDDCIDTHKRCERTCSLVGGPCCAVECGRGCCESGERCINEQEQLCCGSDQSICAAEESQECCNPTEVCIDSGPRAGTCCDSGDRCVNSCCNTGDSCLPAVSLCCAPQQTPCVDRCCEEAGCIEVGSNAGVCCDPANICGSLCCSELDDCIFTPTANTCCGFATPACGNKCCNAGESCVDSTSVGGTLHCCPNERLCDDFCCAQGSGCHLPTNTCRSCPQPNQKYCSAADGCCLETEVCTPVLGLCCQAGEMYCGSPASCRPAVECIR